MSQENCWAGDSLCLGLVKASKSEQKLCSTQWTALCFLLIIQPVEATLTYCTAPTCCPAMPQSHRKAEFAVYLGVKIKAATTEQVRATAPSSLFLDCFSEERQEAHFLPKTQLHYKFDTRYTALSTRTFEKRHCQIFLTERKQKCAWF